MHRGYTSITFKESISGVLKQTAIHVTRKLEKLIKKWIDRDQNVNSGPLGKWNATVFYVDRKKCWLLTNGISKYNVILTDIRAADLKNIQNIFKEAFYTQLIYDSILTDFKKLDTIVGSLVFLPTDNDRQTTGFQNHRLSELNWWSYDIGGLEQVPIRDLNHKINTSPYRIGKGYTQDSFTDSINEMNKLLMNC